MCNFVASLLTVVLVVNVLVAGKAVKPKELIGRDRSRAVDRIIVQ